MKSLLFLLSAVVLGVCGCKKSSGGYMHNSSEPITVSAISPSSGPFGTELLIKGSNFTSDTSKIKVSINGVPLTVVGVDGGEIMVAVTAKTGSGPVVVNIDGKTGTSASAFGYVYSYSVSTLAGSGTAGFGDGVGTGASFNFNGVRGQLCVDSALNVYVADGGNQRVRKIAADGTVSTIAGMERMDMWMGPGRWRSSIIRVGRCWMGPGIFMCPSETGIIFG